MNNLEFLIQQPYTPADVFRFGLVTGTAPLRVRLDGDTAQTEVTPVLLCAVETGNRVLVQIHNLQLIVVGRVTVSSEDSRTAYAPRLRLTAGDDASPTSTGHAFQIGPSNGLNIIIDTNELMARDNGVAVRLYVEGGITGGPAPSAAGDLTRKDYVDQRTLTGSDTITPSAANTPTSKTVTFPAGRFNVAPTVMATPSTTVPGTTVTGWAVTDVTATNFKLWVTRTNTTNTLLNWVAISNG